MRVNQLDTTVSESYALILNLGHQNHLKVLYCQSKPSAPKARASRHIPQSADRILDAPGLYDDFCKYKQ